jgi:hypothetical protein
MDSANAARKGRPPAPVPTMPLFLGAARTRVKEEMTISAPVARELRAYVDWASGLAVMPDDEVRVRTIDHALTEYFRNDKAWQKDRADFLGGAAPAPKSSSAAKADTSPVAAVAGKQDSKPAGPPSPAAGKGV